MRSDLIFFDTFAESKKGVYRGFIYLILFTVINILWFNLTKDVIYSDLKVDYTKFIPSFFVTGILIGSALGVHLPSSPEKASLYGMLVGLVIYTISNLLLYNFQEKWTFCPMLIDILYGVISTSFIALIGYYIIF